MNPVHPPITTPPTLRFRAVRLAGPADGIDCGDWEIGAGEAWFVAGGNGAGKTRLIRTLAGLEPVRAGRIERFGEDWTEFPESETLPRRRRIGVVLGQGAGLFHRATILDNVRLPLLYHRGNDPEAVEARVQTLLAALDLEAHAHLPSVRAGPLLARRALLARALALAPEVLLLDDPCAGLDDRERRQLVALLARLRAGGAGSAGQSLTVVLTGRAPAEWREFPDLRWAHLRGGALTPLAGWEQLVASAPELFQSDGVEASPD